MNNIISWLAASVCFGSIILIGAIGETLTEKSGHLNLGVPGIMYLCGFISFITVFKYERSVANPSAFVCIIVPIVACLLTGGILGLLYSFMCVTLKCNQNVMGLVLASFGVGFGKFLCTICNINDGKVEYTSELFTKGIPGLSKIPYLGPVLFNYGFIIYLVLVLTILLHLFLKKTRIGMNLKSVGEDPAASDAVGIDVSKYKYVATIIGCALCGLGGLIYVFVFSNGSWSTANNIEAIGWLSVALVIFASWKPLNAIWGSYLFGFLLWAYNYLPSLFNMPIVTGFSEILKMLPYLFTIIVLIINSLNKKRENQPPHSLGISYFREDR